MLADETDMFEGLRTHEKQPEKSLHVRDVPTPMPAHGEELVAVMASSINYNTAWSAIFEPIPTFQFLSRYGRTGAAAKRHDLPYHVVGWSRPTGGPGTPPRRRKWKFSRAGISISSTTRTEWPSW